eukprot:g63928.t1
MALEDAQEKLTAEAWYDYEWEVVALQVELSEGHTGSMLYSDQQHQQSRGARNVRVTRSVTVMISYVRTLSFR